jgi:membrane protease subunit HflC
MKRLPIFTIVTAAALVTLLLVYATTYQVRFSERVVKIRFGQVLEAEQTPGIYAKWPAPIETVRAYDTRIRVLDTPETELKTQDGQTLIIGCTAIWQIEDPRRFHIRFPSERDAEDKLRARINEARDTVIGRHTMSDLVNLDSRLVDEAHTAIYKEIRDAASPDFLNSEYGIKLVQVSIRRISLPETATNPIQAAMAAERTKEAERFRQEGQSTAETIKSRARSQADTIRQFAARRAEEIASAGQIASERILAEIRGEDTEFFIWLRYLEALQASLRTKTTIILDSEADLFGPFSKPLEGSSAPASPGKPDTKKPPAGEDQ